MTTPGDRPRRSGFLSNLSSALTPPIVTDDDPDKPLVMPTTIKVATVLTLLAGLLFLFLGVNGLLTLNSGLATAVTQYNEQMNECTTKVGGISGQAKAPEGSDKTITDLAGTCSKFTEPTVTDDMKNNAKSRASTISGALIVFGLAALVAGWFLRTGVAWARRAAVGLVIVTMIGTMFLQISTLFTMVGTLFLVAAVLMSYLGRGGVYFAKTAMRRRTA